MEVSSKPFVLFVRTPRRGKGTHSYPMSWRHSSLGGVWRDPCLCCGWKKYPQALRWYRTFEKAHPNTVPTTQTLLEHCWNVWHLERKKERQRSQSSGSLVTMGGLTSTTAGFPVKTWYHWKKHDVFVPILVLRDLDESCQYARVSSQPPPPFQKPIASNPSICGAGMACGHGQFVATHHPYRGGINCQRKGSSALRAMARTSVWSCMTKMTKVMITGGTNVANWRFGSRHKRKFVFIHGIPFFFSKMIHHYN